MRRVVLLGTVAATLFVASSCGGGGARRVAPTGFGVYVAQAGTADRGTRFTYEIPAPVEDYAVSRLDRFRVKVGGPAVTYLLVGADASRAIRDVAVNLGADVEVVTEAGRRVRFLTAPEAVAAWLARAGPALASDVVSEGSQLETDYQLGALTLPGTVGKTVLVADEPVPSVAGIVTGFFGTGGRPLVPRRLSPPRRPASAIQQR